MPTIQHPEYVVINGERYPVAHDKKGARIWREIRVPVQSGGGEKQVTFDSWDLGFGHSRLKQEGTYEYGTKANATHPYMATIGPSRYYLVGTSGCVYHRLIEYKGSVYALGVKSSDDDIFYAQINSTPAIAVESEIGAGQADGPPGQCAVWEDELYVGVTAGTNYKLHTRSDSGTANAAVTCGASTLTDSREAWTVNEWAGATITCDSKTMTVETNTATALTGAAAWSPSQPADGNSWALSGKGWLRGNACNALHFCRVGRDMWGVPLDTTGKISKLPAGSSWTWGTDDTAVGTTPWGALYGVGDIGQGISGLHEWGRWLYVGKADGLFSGDEDGNLWNQIPEVVESSSNCLRLAKWQGMLWAPTIDGLYRHMGLGSRTQGPEVLIDNGSDIRGGYFTALAKGGQWLYGAFAAQNGTTYIMTARLRESDEPGRGELVWHVVGEAAADETVSDMLVSTITSPPSLFWVCSVGTNSKSISYYVLNKDCSLNPVDSSYRSMLNTAAWLYLPRIDLGSPGTVKAGHLVEVHAGGTMDSSKKIRIYYRWDDSGGFTQLTDGAGTVKTLIATGFDRCYWTGGASDTGRSLQLAVNFLSNSTSARPELDKLTVSLIESPRREPGIRCSLRVANRLDKKRSAYQVETDLNGLDCGSTYAMTDPDDPAAGTVRVVVHDMEFIPTEDPGSIQGERQCNLTLRIVDYS